MTTGWAEPRAGRPKSFGCLGYYDHDYHAAHRRLVAEELKQCVGRARATLANGVSDTVIFSTEELGYSLADFEIHPVTRQMLTNWAKIHFAYFEIKCHPSLYNINKQLCHLAPELGTDGILLKTSLIVQRLEKANRTIIRHLNELAAFGLIDKIGERSGWRLTAAHLRKFINVGGGAALESLLYKETF